MSDRSIQHRLAAIAEPNRFQIVELLREGPRPVNDIAHSLKMGQPQVSRHLRLLSEAQIVGSAKQGQQRIYRLRPESMREINEWSLRFADIWSERMDRLGNFLKESGH